MGTVNLIYSSWRGSWGGKKDTPQDNPTNPLDGHTIPLDDLTNPLDGSAIPLDN